MKRLLILTLLFSGCALIHTKPVEPTPINGSCNSYLPKDDSPETHFQGLMMRPKDYEKFNSCMQELIGMKPTK